MKKDRLLSLALVVSMALAGCGPKQTESEGAKTYTGSAQGNNGPVKVEVVVENGGVNAVTVTEHGETPGICDAAIETIPAAIVAGQTLNVEAVSGATNTSKAILAAVEDCVKQAGGDVEALTGPIQGGSEKKEESRTADIVIVGSGIAGLSAALSAAETGADVVVLEKMATTGGTTALSGAT